MSYTGRVEIRVLKEGKDLEVLDLKTMPQRGIQYPLLVDEVGAEDLVRNALEGRTDGIWDIAGAYHEHYSQDYWGEWDADYWLESERLKLVGK